MDEDLARDIPCSSLAVDAILRIGTAGAIWGIFWGPYGARKKGLTGAARAAFVAKSVGSYGLQCALIGGTYTMTHCLVQRYRRRNDWVNNLVAGAVTGAGVGASTRSWTLAIGMAVVLPAVGIARDRAK